MTTQQEIRKIEFSLPARCRFWLNDANANKEDMDDAGQNMLNFLKRNGWSDHNAVDTVNRLFELYGHSNSFRYLKP